MTQAWGVERQVKRGLELESHSLYLHGTGVQDLGGDGKENSPRGTTLQLENLRPFGFERRQHRLDWRFLHTIDVDRLVRETDIDVLESTVETIAFGDIQAEDTRNYTEGNFVKIFRLAQLMVEYLLYNQDLLASHKAQLMKALHELQSYVDSLRKQCLSHKNALQATTKENKRFRKQLRTYEMVIKLKEQGWVPPGQGPVAGDRPVGLPAEVSLFPCKYCGKQFQSAAYLHTHMNRRHVDLPIVGEAASDDTPIERSPRDPLDPSSYVPPRVPGANKPLTPVRTPLANSLNPFAFATGPSGSHPGGDKGTILEDDNCSNESESSLPSIVGGVYTAAEAEAALARVLSSRKMYTNPVYHETLVTHKMPIERPVSIESEVHVEEILARERSERQAERVKFQADIVALRAQLTENGALQPTENLPQQPQPSLVEVEGLKRHVSELQQALLRRDDQGSVDTPTSAYTEAEMTALKAQLEGLRAGQEAAVVAAQEADKARLAAEAKASSLARDMENNASKQKALDGLVVAATPSIKGGVGEVLEDDDVAINGSSVRPLSHSAGGGQEHKRMAEELEAAKVERDRLQDEVQTLQDQLQKAKATATLSAAPGIDSQPSAAPSGMLQSESVDVQSLKMDLKNAEAESEALRAHMERLENERKGMIEDGDGKDATMRELSNRAEQLTAQCAELKRENLDLQAKARAADDLQEKLAAAEKALAASDLSSAAQELQAQLKAARQQHTSTEAELQQMKEKLQGSLSGQQEAERQLQQLQKEKQQMVTEQAARDQKYEAELQAAKDHTKQATEKLAQLENQMAANDRAASPGRKKTRPATERHKFKEAELDGRVEGRVTYKMSPDVTPNPSPKPSAPPQNSSGYEATAGNVEMVVDERSATASAVTPAEAAPALDDRAGAPAQSAPTPADEVHGGAKAALPTLVTSAISEAPGGRVWKAQQIAAMHDTDYDQRLTQPEVVSMLLAANPHSSKKECTAEARSMFCFAGSLVDGQAIATEAVVRWYEAGLGNLDEAFKNLGLKVPHDVHEREQAKVMAEETMQATSKHVRLSRPVQQAFDDKYRYIPVQNKPFVVSRHAHEPELFSNVQQEMTQMMQTQLSEAMQSYGLDPNAEELSNAQYAAAMQELERRREERLRSVPADAAAQVEMERLAMMFHVSAAMHQEFNLGSPQRSAASSPSASVALTASYNCGSEQMSADPGKSVSMRESAEQGGRSAGNSWGYHPSSDLGRSTFEQSRQRDAPRRGPQVAIQDKVVEMEEVEDVDSEFDLSPTVPPRRQPLPRGPQHVSSSMEDSLAGPDDVEEIDNIDTLTASIEEGSTWTRSSAVGDSLNMRSSSPVAMHDRRPQLSNLDVRQSSALTSIGSPHDSDDMVEEFIASQGSPMPRGPDQAPPSPGSRMVEEELNSMDFGKDGLGNFKKSDGMQNTQSQPNRGASPGMASLTSLSEFSDVEEIAL